METHYYIVHTNHLKQAKGTCTKNQWVILLSKKKCKPIALKSTS